MATVTFIRNTTENIANIPIVDGQIILSTDENFIYLDNGNQRIQYRNNGIASGIQYSNTSSGLSADDVQEAIDEVAGKTKVATTNRLGIVKPDGTSISINAQGVLSTSHTASGTSYNNSSSGMVANNVQAAIDELKTMIDNLSTSLGQTYYTKTQVDNKLDDKMNKNQFSLSGTTLDITLT